MGNVQTNINESIQEVTNEIMSVSVAKSEQSCKNIDQYSNVIIENVTIGGDLNFDQLCEIKGNAAIDNYMETAVNNILDSLQKQKQSVETSFFQALVNVQTNRNTLKQTIKNSVLQMAYSSCQQTVSNLRSHNVYAVRNSTIAGSVNYKQGGSVDADCVLKNVANVVASNKLKGEQEQEQSTVTGFGNILAIVAAVAIVIVLGIVAYFVFTKGSGGSAASGVKFVDTRGQPVPGPGGVPPGGVPSGVSSSGTVPKASSGTR